MTTSNSFRFVWNDAAINCDTNNLVSAALELFRNGDVSVSTNGVAAYLPRELPFPHAGFGQYFRGQAPRSPIFQCFRDIGPVATPIFASLGCFPEMNNFTGKKGPFYVIAFV